MAANESWSSDLAQRFADTMNKAELIPHEVDFNSKFDQSFLKKALVEVGSQGHVTEKIQVFASEKN